MEISLLYEVSTLSPTSGHATNFQSDASYIECHARCTVRSIATTIGVVYKWNFARLYFICRCQSYPNPPSPITLYVPPTITN